MYARSSMRAPALEKIVPKLTVAVGRAACQRPGQERLTQVLTNDARHQRQKLRGPFQRAICAEDTGLHEIAQQRGENGQKGDGTSGCFEALSHAGQYESDTILRDADSGADRACAGPQA